MNATRYGFRVVGSPFDERRLVDWQAAFLAYADCDERAETDRESYLSAFTFGADFRDYLDATGSTRGYSGACGSPWLWFDIDRTDLDTATRDARRLAAGLAERFKLDDELLIFFSGSKGFHLGLPMALCGSPAPSADFHRVARRFAERQADCCQVAIDTGVYDRVRLFRAPNSRHPKTGLFKRWLDLEQLLHLRTAAIVELARETEPFDLREPPAPNSQAVDDWQAAGADVARAATVRQARQARGGATLNRSTLDFLRDGAGTGDRHRLLFSAAANLAELHCSPALAHELLTEAGLDSGLPPGEVRRQIDCGLQHGAGIHCAGISTGSPPGKPNASTITGPDASTGSPLDKAKGTPDGAGLRDDLRQLWNRSPDDPTGSPPGGKPDGSTGSNAVWISPDLPPITGPNAATGSPPSTRTDAALPVALSALWKGGTE